MLNARVFKVAQAIVSAVRVSGSTLSLDNFECYRDGDVDGYTVPEIAGVALKMAQELLDVAIQVEEKEALLEFGDTSEVEVEENQWTKDAMGDLPDWSSMSKKKSKIGDKDIVSIQRLLFWFVKETKNGTEMSLPVVDPMEDALIPALPTDYIRRVPGVVVSVEGRREVVEDGCVLVNGWIVNGRLLKSALDGNSVRGTSKVNRAGGLSIDYNGREKGALPSPLFARADAEVLLGYAIDVMGVQFGSLVEKVVETWCDGVIAFDSPVKDLAAQVVEYLGEKMVEVAEEAKTNLILEGRSIGLNQWAFAKLEEVVDITIENQLPLWSPETSNHGYGLIPAPWELVKVRDGNDFGKAKMAKSKIREIGEFTRRFVKTLVQSQRSVSKFVEGQFAYDITVAYVERRFSLVQRERWADVKNVDTEIGWEETKRKIKENAKLARKGEAVYGATGGLSETEVKSIDIWLKALWAKHYPNIERK